MKKLFIVLTFAIIGWSGAIAQTVYITNNGSGSNTNTVFAINVATHLYSIIGNGNNNGTWGVSVSPDGSKVYVTSDGNNPASVINTATNTVTAIPVDRPLWEFV